ncbi:MAG: PAS domain S-box protein [Opitutales bacterium]
MPGPTEPPRGEASGQRDLEARLKRERRLNAVLRGVRGVNQLITKVDDRDELIRGACRHLAGTMGYDAAWIALTRTSDEVVAVAAAAEAGGAAKAAEFRTRVLGGERPTCLRRALATAETVVIAEPAVECPQCVFASRATGSGISLSRRLAFGERVFGALSVSVPREFMDDPEELSLFAEIAEDLGFALQKIENAEREQRLHTLRLRTERIAGIGSWEWNLETGEILFSDELFRIFGLEATAEVPAYESQREFYHPEDFARLEQALELCREEGTPFELELRVVRRDGTVRHCVGRGEAERGRDGPAGRLYGSLQDVTERREGEIALQHAYERTRYIVEHMNSAAAVFDRDLRFLYVSRRFLEAYRVKEEAVIGRHHYEVFPDLPEAWRQMHQRALAGEVLSSERDRYERADGSVDWTRWECRPWYDHNGRVGGMILFTEVITDRVRAENELRESEERYRALFESNHAVMLLIDPRTLAVVDANPAAVRFYGWDRKTLRGMSIDAINVLSREEIEAEIAAARVDRRDHFLFRHRRADGSTCDVEVYTGSLEFGGRPVVYSIIHDITERRMAERALRESEERQRALIEASPLALFALDRDRRILTWNAAAERIFGWREAEVAGRLPPIVPAGEEESFDELTRRVLEGGLVARAEVMRQRRDGSLLEVSLSAGPVRDAAGAVVGIMTVIEDISARRELERERETLLHTVQEKKEAAEAASRAKDEFLGVMSHEMRTPLNAILGFSSLLLEEAGSEDEREALGAIVEAGEQQLRLVDDILEFARLDRGRLRPKPVSTDLVSLCAEVARHGRPMAAAKGLSLQFENGFAGLSAVPAQRQVRCDVGMLSRALKNLLENACKYTRSGSVCLCLAELDAAGPGRSRFRFEVKDTGIGIEPDKVGQIFEAFTQVDSSYTREFGGTGLGLAICRNLVEAMGGELAVESRPGEGSSFWFELELEQLPGEDAATSKTGAAGPRLRLSRPLEVLIVDDRPSNAEVVQAFLVRLGARGTAVPSAAEALACCAHRRFDVILMDLSMPEMDGFEATRQLRARPGPNQRTPVLAMTADATEQSEVLSRAAGMEEHLTKPFRLEHLWEVLEAYARRHA